VLLEDNRPPDQRGQHQSNADELGKTGQEMIHPQEENMPGFMKR
jgi:hypothetical protein